MTITTTNSVDGYSIAEYKGIVFGEVISGVDFLRDLAASFTNFFGGRSHSYENELITARENALSEMAERAAELGANAVVGVKIDYETLGQDGSMLMVTASGTAAVSYTHLFLRAAPARYWQAACCGWDASRASTARRWLRFCPDAKIPFCSSTPAPMWIARANICANLD